MTTEKSKGAARRPRRYRDLNLASWERWADSYERRHLVSLGRSGGKAWGLWRVPERQLRLLEGVRDKDVLELGCGAAWWSIALAHEGARVMGLDFSPKRLEQARRLMARARVDFPLVRAHAEFLPYPPDCFDLVLSDYGATTFTDPLRTIPETARVLRPGGLLVFAHASPFRSISEDPRTDRVRRRFVRDYFDLHALRTPDNVEFQLPYGRWIDLFRSSGLAVERLVEISGAGLPPSTYLSRESNAWGRHWPMESIWKLRKTQLPRAVISSRPPPREPATAALLPPRRPTRKRGERP